MNIFLMSAGREVLKNSLSNNTIGVVSSFEIGTDVGFIPDLINSTSASSLVYTGDTTQIYKTIVTNNELILTIFIPYNIAMPIGNIMIKLSDSIPLFWMISNKVFNKQNLNAVEHYAGDIYFIPFVIRYPSITRRLDLTNLPDFYAKAPISTNILNMNDVWDNNCDQQQIDNSDYTFNKGRPIYSTKVNNKWWGTPFAIDLDDSRKFVIDGGDVGDNYVYSKK